MAFSATSGLVAQRRAALDAKRGWRRRGPAGRRPGAQRPGRERAGC